MSTAFVVKEDELKCIWVPEVRQIGERIVQGKIRSVWALITVLGDFLSNHTVKL